ncbi:hypothetical protein LRAMOSA06050 [Lichtheimia ramosa]|uniref:Endoplasmic reticulum-Golgi intermediate compartment protein 3 n=1 Tax=Lichtheimia ramosa TaxID=688394 RepID=A0A077X1Y7_9FUNG|nr:hypothetical protein LRAMOSA06050 [Lichtheimia ramosa]
MSRKSLLQRFRRLDAYAKPLDDIRIRTASGAYVSLMSGVIIFILFLYEVSRYLTPEMQPEIVVDSGKMTDLPISFNITFPHLPCYFLSLDVMDESGDHVTDYDHDVFKVRLDADGKEIHREKATELSNKLDPTKMAVDTSANDYCGPCYGANPKGEANPCCNTCDDVRRAYSDMGWKLPDESNLEQCVNEHVTSQQQEGCNMHGELKVRRVRGNFHFSPGKSFVYGGAHIHDVRTYLSSHHDFSHIIHSLQFGEQKELAAYKQKRTKMVDLANPLDDSRWGNAQSSIMYQYFLKIVPAEINYLSGKSIHTYQYSVSRQERDLQMQANNGLPGVFINMDFSPMLVIYSETRPTFASFLTGVCAIVGGIFTVASLIDGVIYRTSLHRKRQLGKAM